jgi:hypothetical protein
MMTHQPETDKNYNPRQGLVLYIKTFWMDLKFIRFGNNFKKEENARE